MKDYNFAISDFSKALNICEQLALDNTTLDIYYYRGLSYFYKEDYTLALSDFTAANDNNIDVLIFIARTYKYLNIYEISISYYNKIISMEPSNFLAYYELGLIYMDIKNYSIALKNFNKSIQINPNLTEAYYYIDLSISKNQSQ